MSRYSSKVTLLVLWLCFFLNQAYRQLFNVLIPLFRSEFSLSDQQIGLIASVSNLALGICIPFAGFMGDRFNKKYLVAASIFLGGLAMINVSFASLFLLILIFRAVGSVGESLYGPSANTLISLDFVKDRGKAMAFHQTALYAGMIGAGTLGTYLGETYGWRNAFLWYGLAGIAATALVVLFIKPQHPGHDSKQMNWRLVLDTLLKPSVLVLIVTFGFKLFVNVAILTWMPDIMHQAYGFSVYQAGFYTMLLIFGFAYIGSLAGGFLADRLYLKSPKGRVYVQLLSLFTELPLIILMGLPLDLPFKMVVFALYGLTIGLYDANIFAVLYEFVPAQVRSSLTGITVMGAFLTATPAPIILGYFDGFEAKLAIFPYFSLVYLLGILLFLFLLIKRFAKDRVVGR